ncbi:MAG: tetratricopeptide repeat protein [Desulfovibrio sp.]
MSELRQDREKIQGVFSTQSVSKVGTGTTVRRTIQKMYWFAQELEDGDIEMQPLNVNNIPSGPKQKVVLEDFLARFTPEPEFYHASVFPKLKEVDENISRGDKFRAKGASYSAELEYQLAAEVDEENVRANFGLGLTYLERGEPSKANDIFERLIGLEAAFEQEHKHLFNDFGINLRKSKMLDQALTYYLRAEELAKKDEHLFYNVARVYYDKSEYEKCGEFLGKSLEINPNLKESQDFVEYLDDKGLVPGLAKKLLGREPGAGAGEAPPADVADDGAESAADLAL